MDRIDMTSESPGTKLIKQAFEGLTGFVELPPTTSLYYNPPSKLDVRKVEFEKSIPGIGKGGRIPDILLTDADGRKLAIELYNTNAKTREWIEDIASIGLLAIEVDVVNLKPDFGATYAERANVILRNGEWLNPGPPANLKWSTYTNILSYHQSCETGFVLERNGAETRIFVLSEHGKWRSAVRGGKAGISEVVGGLHKDLLAAVQEAWVSAHNGRPLSDIPACPTIYYNGLDITDSRLKDIWSSYYRCTECRGVIPDFGLVLNFGARLNGQEITTFRSSMFPLAKDLWEGRSTCLYVEARPDNLYCWLCAALRPEPLGWRILLSDKDDDSIEEPPGFKAFCNWKRAQAEESRRIRYQALPPGSQQDNPDVSIALNHIETLLGVGDLEAGLEALLLLKAYQPRSRIRAVELAKRFTRSWFQELPYPLQRAISVRGVDSESHPKC